MPRVYQCGKQIVEFEESHPVISRPSRKSSKCGVGLLSPTRADMQRYRGILDALVAELEEDGVL